MRPALSRYKSVSNFFKQPSEILKTTQKKKKRRGSLKKDDVPEVNKEELKETRFKPLSPFKVDTPTRKQTEEIDDYLKEIEQNSKEMASLLEELGLEEDDLKGIEFPAPTTDTTDTTEKKPEVKKVKLLEPRREKKEKVKKVLEESQTLLARNLEDNFLLGEGIEILEEENEHLKLLIKDHTRVLRGIVESIHVQIEDEDNIILRKIAEKLKNEGDKMENELELLQKDSEMKKSKNNAKKKSEPLIDIDVENENIEIKIDEIK